MCKKIELATNKTSKSPTLAKYKAAHTRPGGSLIRIIRAGSTSCRPEIKLQPLLRTRGVESRCDEIYRMILTRAHANTMLCSTTNYNQ